MASVHDEDAGAALAALLDGWSDCELLPLPLLDPAPATVPSGGLERFPVTPEAAEKQDDALLTASATRDRYNVAPHSEGPRTAPRSARKSAGDSNVTRKREREERRRLEIEVFGLERQLASTLGRRQLAVGASGGGGGGGEHSSAQMWARVARNQLRAKQAAELQNATLRELLSEQLRLARSMERLVSRRPSEAALVRVFGSTDVVPRKRLRLDASIDDGRTFERLFECVDRSYDELDRVFDAKDAQSSSETSAQRKFVYSAVVPFERRAAMAAAWEFLSRDQQSAVGGEYRVVKHTAATIACESVTTIGTSRGVNCGGTMHVRMRCAMKKTEERDRIVLVWQSSTDREALTSSRLTTEPALEQSGWLVLSDVSSDCTATRIQMCVRQPATLNARPPSAQGSFGQEFLLQQDEAKHESSCAMDPLTELIFRDARENVGAWYQYVENILIEQQRVRSTSRAAG